LERLLKDQIKEEKDYFEKESNTTMEELLNRNGVHHIGRTKSALFGRDAWSFRQFVECENANTEDGEQFKATTECCQLEKDALEHSISLLIEEYRSYSYFEPTSTPVVAVDPVSQKLTIEGDPEVIHHLQCLGLAHYFCIPANMRIWDRKKTTRLHPLLLRLYACLPLFRNSIRDYPNCGYYGPHDPNQLYCFTMIMASWCNHTFWFINAESMFQFVMTPKDPYFHLYNHIHRLVDIYYDDKENFLVSLRTEGVFAHVGRFLTLRGLRYIHEKAYFAMGNWYRRSFITKEHPGFNLLHKWVLNHFLLKETNPRLVKYAIKVNPRTKERVVDLHILSLLVNTESSTKGYFQHKASNIAEMVPNFFLMAMDLFAINSTLSKQMVSSLLHEFRLDNQQLVSIINPALVPAPLDASKEERAVHKKARKGYTPPDDRPATPAYMKGHKYRQETRDECALRQNLFHLISKQRAKKETENKKPVRRRYQQPTENQLLEDSIIDAIEGYDETRFIHQYLPKSMIDRNRRTLLYQKHHDPTKQSEFYVDQQNLLNHPKAHRRPSTFSERVLERHYDCSFVTTMRLPPESATDSFVRAIGTNVTAAESLVDDPFIRDDEDYEQPHQPFSDSSYFDVNNERVIYGDSQSGYKVVATSSDYAKRKRKMYLRNEKEESSPKRQCCHLDPHPSQIRSYSTFVKYDRHHEKNKPSDSKKDKGDAGDTNFQSLEEEFLDCHIESDVSVSLSSSSSSSSFSTSSSEDEDDDDVIVFTRAPPLPKTLHDLRVFHKFDPDLPDEDDHDRAFFTMARKRAARKKDKDVSEEDMYIDEYESIGALCNSRNPKNRFGGNRMFKSVNLISYSCFVREPITKSNFIFRFNRDTDRLSPLLTMLSILDYEVMRRALVTHKDRIETVPFCTSVDPTTPPSLSATDYLFSHSVDLPIHVRIAGRIREDGELEGKLHELALFHRTFYLRTETTG